MPLQLRLFKLTLLGHQPMNDRNEGKYVTQPATGNDFAQGIAPMKEKFILATNDINRLLSSN